VSRRKGEITARQTERDFPHLVECLYHQAASGQRATTWWPSTESVASRRGVAADETKPGISSLRFASLIPPTPTLSRIGSGALG
jgi:hypothetical protein